MSTYVTPIQVFLDSHDYYSLTADIVSVENGLFVVKAQLLDQDVNPKTGELKTYRVITSMASSSDVATAEDLAYDRVLKILFAGDKLLYGTDAEKEEILKEDGISPAEITQEPVDEQQDNPPISPQSQKITDPPHALFNPPQYQQEGVLTTEQQETNGAIADQSVEDIKQTMQPPLGFGFGVTTQPQEVTELDTKPDLTKIVETVEPPASENLPTEENTLAPLGGIMGEMFKGITEQQEVDKQEVAPEPEPKKTRKRKPKSTEMEETTIPPSEPDSTKVLPLIPQAQPSVAIQSSLLPESPAPEVELLDFAEVIADTNRELKRLEWTNEQGKNYLLQTYGKRSRQLLTDEELIEFLEYLKSLPSP